MTPKQKLFVSEYALDLNATRAAVAAGYSEKTAYSAGGRLLKNVEIKAAIEQKVAKACQKLDISADKVLSELSKMGFANILDFMVPTENGKSMDLDLSKLTREQAAAIQEFTVDTTGGTGDGERRKVLRTRFKLADKRGSLELLGQYLKLFSDRIEHTGEGGGPIQTAVIVKFVSPSTSIRS